MKKTILKSKEVLAVDDEPDVLALIDEELEEYGVILDTASTYEEAADKIASMTYDIAILDIMGVRGFELLSQAVTRKISGGDAHRAHGECGGTQKIHRDGSAGVRAQGSVGEPCAFPGRCPGTELSTRMGQALRETFQELRLSLRAGLETNSGRILGAIRRE